MDIIQIFFLNFPRRNLNNTLDVPSSDSVVSFHTVKHWVERTVDGRDGH